jgi:aminopeptidase N
MRENASQYFDEDPVKYRRPLIYDRYRVPVDLFDNTLYKKGALVVHMLRETVGDAVFWKALNTYLNKYKEQSVVTADLQRVFEQASGQRLDWFFDQWAYKAGFPELRVRSNYNPASHELTLDVSQTQVPDATTPAVFRLPAVEVELADAKGSRTERIEITGRDQRFTFKTDGKPLMIRFDKGARILKKLDFPQSAAMLSYQLLHSADAIGRIEAAEALALLLDRTVPYRATSRTELVAKIKAKALLAANPEVLLALRQAIAHDSFHGVRKAASETLARFGESQTPEVSWEHADRVSQFGSILGSFRIRLMNRLNVFSR